MIGIVIFLIALSKLFSNSFAAFDAAATQSLRTIEMAAIATQQELKNH